MNPNPLDVERQLAALVPLALDIDRDALLYSAGYAAARRSRLSALWPVATAVMTAATVLLALRGTAAPTAKPQAAATIAKTAPTEPTSPLRAEPAPNFTAWWDFGPRPRALNQLVAERDLQLRWEQSSQLCCGAGLPVDALDFEDFTPAKAVTNRELLEEMLRPTM
jgi:hypothetical protein